MRHFVLFFSAKDLNHSGIHREMSAMYGDKYMCKAQVYSWATKSKISVVTSFLEADRLGQLHERLGVTFAKKTGQRGCFVFFVLKFRR